MSYIYGVNPFMGSNSHGGNVLDFPAEQVNKIGHTMISSNQWTILGSLNQYLSTAANVIFSSISALNGYFHDIISSTMLVDTIDEKTLGMSVTVDGINMHDLQTELVQINANIEESKSVIDLDTDISSKRLFIAHRFSKGTQPIYNLECICNQIRKGVKHVELDLWYMTGYEFILTHGGPGEELDISPIHSMSSLYASTVVHGNPALYNGETLPTLEEAWNCLKGTNVILWIELKHGTELQLLQSFIRYRIPSYRVVIQDFDSTTINFFHALGYKTMFVQGSNWSAAPNADYIAGPLSQASNMQLDGRKFVVYTVQLIQHWINYDLLVLTNLVGCFTDIILPIMYLDRKTPLMSILDHRSGFVACQGSDYDTRNFNFNYVKLQDKLTITSIEGSAITRRMINCYGYLVPDTFYIRYLRYSPTSNWFGVYLRFCNDISEFDDAGTRNLSYLLTIDVDDDRLQSYYMISGTTTLMSTMPLAPFPLEIYIGINISQIGECKLYIKYSNTAIDIYAPGPTNYDQLENLGVISASYFANASRFMSFTSRSVSTGMLEYSPNFYSIVPIY